MTNLGADAGRVMATIRTGRDEARIEITAAGTMKVFDLDGRLSQVGALSPQMITTYIRRIQSRPEGWVVEVDEDWLHALEQGR